MISCSDDNDPSPNNNNNGGGGGNNSGCSGGPSTVTDIDGNTYNVVTIGNQCWMKENLKVSRYRNGDNIPTGLSDVSWASTNKGAYSIYDNNIVNDSIYGKLYNFYTMTDSRDLCPTGWHVPSDAEWTTLENNLGFYSVAGGKMKAVSSLWLSPNTGATNTSGFTGLPGGHRDKLGKYIYISNLGVWWSSTSGTNIAWFRDLRNYNTDVFQGYESKASGFSVRCVRD